MLNRRRLLRDEERWQTRPERKMEDAPERRDQRETDRSVFGLGRLDAGSLIAIPALTHLPDIHPSFAGPKGVTKLESILPLDNRAASRTKEIVYPVVIRMRSIIEILPHNSAPGLLHHADFYPIEVLVI
ncbi:unnamed protein product [Lasius platythorax]|uniref:Uncharacterized protein n=1 Tax=Lasius platythorax TaxID=488582 RepID=A0AAV2NZ87_9HYME